jgi:MOSC domain-containing protein YiiM
MAGTVEAIAIRMAPGAPPQDLRDAAVEAGRGIVGDRYHAGTGTFSGLPGTGRALTLIEAESIAALVDEAGIALDFASSRRNVLTRGVALNDLVGRRFRIGSVECIGTRLCEPCDHLARLTDPGVLRALVHRGGLRADVLKGGEISVGDPILGLP